MLQKAAEKYDFKNFIMCLTQGLTKRTTTHLTLSFTNQPVSHHNQVESRHWMPTARHCKVTMPHQNTHETTSAESSAK
ncbi:hypothetical protein ACOMHN_024314 [Nucella lapillus]